MFALYSEMMFLYVPTKSSTYSPSKDSTRKPVTIKLFFIYSYRLNHFKVLCRLII